MKQEQSARKRICALLDEAHKIAEAENIHFYAAVSDGNQFDDYIFGKFDKLVYLTIDIMKKRGDFVKIFVTAIGLIGRNNRAILTFLQSAGSMFIAKYGNVKGL